MRKYTISLVCMLTAVLLTFQYSEVRTNAIQPQAGRTGAPLELTCGDDLACHNTTPNTFTGNVAISFSGANNTYIPGTTYQVTVTVSEAGINKFGFECTSIDANGDSAGTWLSAVSGSVAFPVAGAVNHRKYVSHHNAGANNTWVIDWKAPAVDKGPLTFYAAGNAANGNALATGDHIYTSSLTIIPGVVGIDEAPANYASLFIQNLVNSDLNVQYDLSSAAQVSVILFNSLGQFEKILFTGNEPVGTHQHAFNVKNLHPGLYFVQFISGNSRHTEKIIVE